AIQAAALAGAAALACIAASAQVPSPNSLPPSMLAQERAAEAGLEEPGDARSIIAGILKDNEQMKPLLDSMNPQAWYDKKGAPSTYILQRQTAQRQLNDVLYSAQLLSRKTGDLSLALDTYFRIEALEVTARSLDEGAREYGSRANADKLQDLIARNFDSRQRLRDYLRDLAANLQQNFKIADEEAQRCRAAASESRPRSRRTNRP
ncbi:MAG: hypothetical protein ACRD4O_15220, partial [Bryobacteraceae bacterium]